MEMAKYILNIFKTQMMIVWSWGASQYIALPDGLMFHVEGFLLTGWVKVLYNEGTDAFDITFLSNRKKEVKKVEEVYLDNLVDVIDHNVENNGNFDYEERVKATYSLC